MTDYVTGTLQTLQNINNLGQSNLNMDQTKANTALTQQNTALREQQVLQAIKSREIQDRQAQLMQQMPPETIISREDGTLGPDDPMYPFVASLKDANKNLQQAGRDVYIAGVSGDFKTHQEALKTQTNAQKEVRQIQQDLMKETDTRMQKFAQSLQEVYSPEDLKQALAGGAQTLGRLPAEGIAKELAQSIPDLDNATPTQIRAAIAPIVNRYTAMGDKLRAQSAKASLDERVANDQERAQEHRENLVRKDRDIATRQAGLSLREREFAYRRDAGDNRQASAAEKDAQNELNKAPEMQSLFKARKSYTTAKSIVDTMDANGMTGVSGADKTALKNEFFQSVANFRSSMATRLNATQAKDFDSAFSKFGAYFEQVGEGGTLSAQAAKGIAEVINRNYQLTNAEVLKKSLQVRSRVYDRGGDPNAVNTSARMVDALKSGMAEEKVDPATGQKYAVFGKDKEDIFPVYDGPKDANKRARRARDEDTED